MNDNTNNNDNTEETKHSLWSPSGASRWMDCTGSLELQSKNTPYEKREPHKNTKRGEILHEISQQVLEGANIDDFDFEEPEHKNWVLEYINYIDKIKTYHKGDCKVIIEEKVTFSEILQGGYGYADCILVSDDRIDVIDLKTGDYLVSPKSNPQFMLYGLGTRLSLIRKLGEKYGSIDTYLHVAQPTRDNFKSYLPSEKEWQEFTNELRLVLDEYSTSPVYRVGAACRFCNYKSVCKHRQTLAVNVSNSTDLVKDKLKPLTERDKLILLNNAPFIRELLDEMEAYFLEKAKDGNVPEGYILSKATTRRKLKPEAEQVLNTKFAERMDEFYDKKLKPLSKIEKIIGADEMADITEKPEGKDILKRLK